MSLRLERLLPSGVIVTLRIEGAASLRACGGLVRGELHAVTSGGIADANLRLFAGRLFTGAEVLRGAKVTILTWQAARELAPSRPK
jgi:hypothetical protein